MTKQKLWCPVRCPVCHNTVRTDKPWFPEHEDGIGKLCAKGTGLPIAALRNLMGDIA